MNSSRYAVLLIILCVLALAGFKSFFIVDQTQQAQVLRFGKPVRTIAEPGLKFKIPMIDKVQFYEKRILVLNADPKTVILQDQDRLIVDAFITYRIVDPLRFYQAVGDEQRMNDRLERILERALRDALGKEDLNTLLSPKRSKIMRDIRSTVAISAEKEGAEVAATIPAEGEEPVTQEAPLAFRGQRNGFGIEIVDVRIMRTDLPRETSDPIYKRMRSDRQKVAEKFRAEGQRESQIIRSQADKERTILLAEAKREAETIRGEGDGLATKIFADAFGQDEDFFAFYRAMQAYRGALGKDDTTLIMSPDNDFLKFMEKN